jgi:hypothetical protein
MPQTPLVHVDFVSLLHDATPEGRRDLLEAARGLVGLDEVRSAGVIEAREHADFDLAFFFVLPEFGALEPFGTHPRYSRFLQHHVAPVLRSFAGADVRLEASMPLVAKQAACVALAAPEETYDWEVRAALGMWTEGLTAWSSAFGLAVGEHQGYRGLAFAFADEPLTAPRPVVEGFGVTLLAGSARSFP